MTIDLATIMQQERDALMGEALAADALGAKVLPYAAVQDIAEVTHTPIALRSRHPTLFVPLVGVTGKGGALVQYTPSLGFRMLWVHADNDRYREDYVTYLRTERGINCTALPETHHVDHLFNRARAQELHLAWIRAVLLPRGVNTSHGAGYEKSRTQGLVGAAGRPRKIDEITLMKLWHLRSPRRGHALAPEMRAHAARMAVLFGLPQTEIERNIAALMAVAAFRPEA